AGTPVLLGKNSEAFFYRAIAAGGCAKPRVAPAMPNCPSQPQRRPQSRAAKPACASARTLDSESVRRLSEQDPLLTSNMVARARPSDEGWLRRAGITLSMAPPWRRDNHPGPASVK